MLDNRKALTTGHHLNFGIGAEYVIESEIGRGASCIVYYGYYFDRIGKKHRIRMKECYPYTVPVSRTEDGELRVPESSLEQFEAEKQKFCASYIRNVELKNTLGIVNSTVDATNLYEKNNTWYVVTGMIEGQDYRANIDEDLQSVLIRMLSLAKVIKKYHDMGILYLDIKPENIFIIPETREHIVLFDFDSLVSMDEIQKGTAKILYSDGYAAPELIRGHRKKIGAAADIYSIGVILFLKIFGKKPDAVTGSISEKYDFSKMRFTDVRYQMKTEFLRKLDMFLHRTVAVSLTYRYKDMGMVIADLEELVRLSDIEAMELCPNFTYSSACFVGRAEELEEISEILEKNHVLFLSGIGGIGKTELAKRYAYEHQEEYRKIVFLPFQNSIMETVCGQDLMISNFQKGEDEKQEDYFIRKLEILKQVSQSDDLIILDNFDVSKDDNLEALFGCPCRFLVTTREDGFRDYNFQQMEIDKIESMEDLTAIFGYYNSQTYTQEEQQSIRSIIEWIDCHTMIVDLIAKYLRNTKEAPAVLLKKLKEKEGITNTEETGIRLRKDRIMREESINRHLTILFDLSGFTAPECELLRSLSLLGYVRIHRKMFLEFCRIANGNEELSLLIQRGWVEYNPDSDKISFHQIILDLVYRYLAPASENCPHMAESMQEYMKKELSNSVERNIRNKLCELFMQRVRGEDLNYARLCVLYCERIRKKKQYLDAAEKVCSALTEREGKHLLQSIFRMKIHLISTGEDRFHEMLEAGTEFEVLFDRDSRFICELAQKAYTCAKEYSQDPAYLGRFCVELAGELDRAAAENIFTMAIDGSDNNASMNRILDLAVKLLDDGERYICDSALDNREKEHLFCKMRDFFGSYDFSAMYRSERYADAGRAFQYQKIIDGFRDKNVFYVDGVDYTSLAEEAVSKGQYQEAIEWYEKAYEDGDEPYEIALKAIANLYMRMGDTDHAIEQLEEILRIDKEYEGRGGLYSSYICCELIDLLIKEGRREKAGEYARELAWYSGSQVDAQEDTQEDAQENTREMDILWLVAAYYRLYLLETDGERKNRYWDTCMKYFSKWKREEPLPSQWSRFLIELADGQESDRRKAEKALEYMEHSDLAYDLENVILFLNYIIEVCREKKELAEYHVYALLRYSRCMMEFTSGQEEKALAYCREAFTQYEEYHLENAYLYNLMYKILGDCYSSLNEYTYEMVLEEKKKCNYYLLAEHDGKKQPVQKKIELWKDAAREYSYLDNARMEEKCLKQAFDAMISVLNLHENGSYYAYSSLAEARMKCYIKLNDQKSLKELGDMFFHEIVYYFTEINGEEEQFERDEVLNRELERYAGCLVEGGLEKEGFAMYLLAVITTVDTKPKAAALYHFYEEGQRNQGILLGALKNVFHGELSGKIAGEVIDRVIAMYEDLIPLFEQNREWTDFEREFKWFSDTYRYSMIEFKK